MHPARRKRLGMLTVGIVLLAVGVTSVLIALNDSINLFYTPSEVYQGKAVEGKVIRIGGLVKPGSVIRGTGVAVTFAITDSIHATPVRFVGILPDLFQENQGIVALGTLQNGVLIASEVLAKHDENYMPPEAMESLQRAVEHTTIPASL